MKAFFGGAYIGLFFAIPNAVLVAAGVAEFRQYGIDGEYGIEMVFLGPPLGAIAGLVAGVILWLDSGRLDN
jgi:hypothetical protein